MHSTNSISTFQCNWITINLLTQNKTIMNSSRNYYTCTQHKLYITFWRGSIFVTNTCNADLKAVFRIGLIFELPWWRSDFVYIAIELRLYLSRYWYTRYYKIRTSHDVYSQIIKIRHDDTTPGGQWWTGAFVGLLYLYGAITPVWLS